MSDAAKFTAGQRVKCWGIFGGPYSGRIVSKDASKDCWVVRYVHNGERFKAVLHEDYLKAKP